MADVLVEIFFWIGLVMAFFYYRVYASPYFWVGLVILIIIMQSEIVRHYSFQTAAVVFGAIYLPANIFLMFLIGKITPFKRRDVIIYSIFRILFFPLQVIVTIFSIPYEWLLNNAH
jgi:hypothetical protein